MLVLTRRVGERLIIGDEIVITIARCRGNQVNIGIDAPADISIHREEVYDRIQSESEPNTETYHYYG